MTKPKSRFLHKLYLVLLERRAGASTRDGRVLWGLQRPMTYETGPNREISIVVPAGYVTDLASIPRLVWSAYPPDGPWVKAAIVHDFLYDTNGTGEWFDQTWFQPISDPPRVFTRKEADDILMEGMLDRGVGWLERKVIYAAVRAGGGGGWDRAGKLKAQREALKKRIKVAAPVPVPPESEIDEPAKP